MESPQASDKQQPEKHLVAFLDIGTNSIRMLLAAIQSDQTFSIVSQQKETVRLGEGEFEAAQLQPQAMRRAALVCGKFAQMARTLGAQEIVAVATSASREATNQAQFLRKLRREAQIDVRVISGKEEARLIYLGVASGLNLGEKRAIFIDIGGGSTEVIVGNQQQYEFLDSLKLGAIRLSNMFFAPGDQGPVNPREYARIQRHVRTISVRTLQQVRNYPLDLAVGSSGTTINLAEIACRMIHKKNPEKDQILTLNDLQTVVKRLCSLPLEERRKIPGLNPDRVDIIIGGAAILETLMEELQIPEIRINERGLREGLPIDYISRTEQSVPLSLASFRERSVLQLGKNCQFDEAHSRIVTQLALKLFDSASDIALHRFGPWERELLEYASLLHDIGVFLSHSNHRAHSYYFIRNADLLGFDQTEIKIIATTSLFHYTQAPRMRNPEYAELDKRSKNVVVVLSMLLRLAESMDRTHTGAITDVAFRELDEQSVVLEITANRDCDLELWGVQKHEKSFEKTFGRTLQISVLNPGATSVPNPSTVLG